MSKKVSKLLSKVIEREKRYKENPIIQKYKPKLSDLDKPSPVWRQVFFRQADAFDFASKQEEDVRVFAVESKELKGAGSRKYIVSTVTEFLFYYKQLGVENRHFYEVIEEDRTCHLYFDLEYLKHLNTEKDELETLDLWIKFVCDFLLYKLNINSDKNNVVILDSSTNKKFSYHLIWHLQNVVFLNNIHVGYFVKDLCFKLKLFINNSIDESEAAWFNNLKYKEKLKQLIITTSDITKLPCLFVDEGVYTKNRNFRLYMSSKISKNINLKLSSFNNFDFIPLTSNFQCCQHHKAHKSKISLYKEKSVCYDKQNLVFLASLCCYLKQSKINTNIISIITIDNSFSNAYKLNICEYNQSCKENSPNTKILEGNSRVTKALIQMISDHIKNLCSKAKVSKCSQVANSDLIVFDVEGTKFCSNIGREHKSNRIMFVANLRSRMFYQKCYDPVCRDEDYRSQPVPFTETVKQLLEFETCDNDLIYAAESFEIINSLNDEKF